MCSRSYLLLIRDGRHTWCHFMSSTHLMFIIFWYMSYCEHVRPVYINIYFQFVLFYNYEKSEIWDGSKYSLAELYIDQSGRWCIYGLQVNTKTLVHNSLITRNCHQIPFSVIIDFCLSFPFPTYNKSDAFNNILAGKKSWKHCSKMKYWL